MNGIFWLDIETTGLRPREDAIMEVGVVLTTPDLQIVDHLTRVVYVPETKLDMMDDFVRAMHVQSGLLALVGSASRTLSMVEDELVAWMSKHGVSQDTFLPPIAGNSVQFDREFIREQMPRFFEMWHYRNQDLSAIRAWAQVWKPELTDQEPVASKLHRPINDIRDSIQLARFYKEHLFT